MRRAFLLPLLVPLCLLPKAALANEDAVATAKKAFAAGAQAYHEARYKDAIDLFLKANALDPHADLVYNVGQAYEKLGDVPNALRSYREYLRMAPGATDRATVEASIRNLEARLRDRGVQQVTIFSTPTGATLLLDGKPVGATPWTGEIAPGRHVAVLHATGYPDMAKEFVLLADRAMDLDVAMSVTASGSAAVALATRTDAPVPQPPGVPPITETKRTVAPWTIAALSVGVASLGVSLGLEIARKNANDGAAAEPTQIGYQNDLNTMTTYQTAARAMVGVGAVVTAAGVVLLAVDLSHPSSAPPAKAGLGCFVGACGVVASGRF